MKTKTFKIIMAPAADAFKGSVFMLNATGRLFTDDITYWKENRDRYTPYNIYIVSNDNLNPGDYCMFYDGLSKVLEINGSSAKIETTTITSKEDAESINEIKGIIVTKEGDVSTMVHSFSTKQLPKVIASNNKLLFPQTWILDSFVQTYVKAYNDGQRIKEVELEGYYGCLSCGRTEENINNCATNSRCKLDIFINTNPDGCIIIVNREKLYSEHDMKIAFGAGEYHAGCADFAGTEHKASDYDSWIAKYKNKK